MALRTPSLAIIVIAAGKGTRMRSPIAKVLHALAGRPLLAHVLEAALPLRPQVLITVVGYQAETVRALCDTYDSHSVLQEPQLGTGHAVAQAEPLLVDFQGDVLILYGDVPLLRTSTMQALWDEHRRQQATVTVLTAWVDDPTGYGRIRRDTQGRIVRIVEERDASPLERAGREINSGVYCIRAPFLFPALRQIGCDNAQGEQYLTDVVAVAVNDAQPVAHLTVANVEEISGVNTPDELARLETMLQNRLYP